MRPWRITESFVEGLFVLLLDYAWKIAVTVAAIVYVVTR